MTATIMTGAPANDAAHPMSELGREGGCERDGEPGGEGGLARAIPAPLLPRGVARLSNLFSVRFQTLEPRKCGK